MEERWQRKLDRCRPFVELDADLDEREEFDILSERQKRIDKIEIACLNGLLCTVGFLTLGIFVFIAIYIYFLFDR